jgi:uncharacterized protein (TIGR04255 family)
MVEYPNLSKAPVAEAVIEVRVRMAGPVADGSYLAFRDRLKGKLPKAQNIRFVMAHLHFDSAEAVKNDLAHSLIGVRLDSEDGKWVVQAKSDGLTVSRMAPYAKWDVLIAELQELWPEYVQVFQPEAIVRLGVRYINKIALPGSDHVDLDTVLTVGPKIPAQLPQNLSQFLTRVVLPIEGEGIVLVISQTLQPEPTDATAPLGHVLLDIDASCEESMAVESPDMWQRLSTLRDVKNMAFFGSLTEPTWRRFL